MVQLLLHRFLIIVNSLGCSQQVSNISRYLICLPIILTLLLSACGKGGSGVTAPAIPQPPIAIKVNAGTNLNVDENQLVSLLGGSSGGQGPHTYAWSNEQNILVDHPDTSTTNATFTAPSVTTTTVFVLTLTATDENQTQQSESINVTVNPVNLLPTVSIQANQIEGYANNQYPLAATILLDGSASSDADPQTNSAPITAYSWQQIAGPNVLAGVNSNQSTLSVVVPTLNQNTTAVFRLTVTDQEQASSSADYSVTLLSQQQTNINVEVSAVRDVFAGEIAMLEAVATSIAPDAPPFAAIWEFVTTPSTLQSPQIQDPTAFTTSVVTPLVNATSSLNYEVTVTDSFRNVTTAQSQTTVYAPSARKINDTGLTLYGTLDSVSTVHPNDFPGQDASYGADRQTASGTVIKMGEGDSGFDFTALDELGNPSDDNATSSACVRDNVTGLIWQVKDNINITSLHYVDQTFTWFSEGENGNFAGAQNQAATSCNVQSQACNTQAYVQAINSQGLCGAFDWRLPSAYELQSIVHYGKTEAPFIDSTFFPYIGANGDQPLWYWTSQSSAEGVANDIARNAWAYDFSTGSNAFLDKTTSRKVMLVRAGR